VGYDLIFAPDVRRWLAALEADQPDVARQVNAALETLKAKGEQTGPPLVVPVSYEPPQHEVAPELDRFYQRRMRALTQFRREVSEVATLRKSLEDRLGDPMTDDQRERLRGAYDGIRAQEERLTEVGKRMDRDLQAFRARKEALKASLVEALIDEMTKLADVADVMGAAEPEQPGGQLMELRPGAPKGIVARLLIAVEPGQAAEVVAAATERDVLSAWYDRVVPASHAPGAVPPGAVREQRTAAP
jgi:hypothetical protein